MSLLDRLEHKLGRYVPANITYFLIGAQVLVFILIRSYPAYTSVFFLQGQLLRAGQWWRALSFLAMPISTDFLFAVFEWYMFYLFGLALERHWGSFRYVIYILISVVSIVTLALLFPTARITNTYIYASVFLAFAYVYPEFRLLLFFFIPVKVKWLAVIAAITMLGSVLFGSVPTKLQTILSVSNFLIFFGNDLISRSRLQIQEWFSHSGKTVVQGKAYHICAVCGTNERDDPDMEIRYCSKCIPSRCFCGDHIRTHVHKKLPN